MRLTTVHRAPLLDLHEVAEALHLGEEVTVGWFSANVARDARDPARRLSRLLAFARGLGVEISMEQLPEGLDEDGQRGHRAACPDVLALRRAVEIGLRRIRLRLRRSPTAEARRARRENRRLHARARAEGTCLNCRKVPPLEGLTQCAPCRDARAENREDAMEALGRLEICLQCRVEPTGGRALCRACAARWNRHKRERIARLRRERLCYLCPAGREAPAPRGFRTCAPCRKRASARNRPSKVAKEREKLRRGICEKGGCAEPVAASLRSHGRPIRKCDRHRKMFNAAKNRRVEKARARREKKGKAA